LIEKTESGVLRVMLSGRRIAIVFVVFVGSLLLSAPAVLAKIPDGTYTFNSTITANSTWQFVLTTIQVAGSDMTMNVDYHNVSQFDQGIDCATSNIELVDPHGNSVQSVEDPCNTIPSPSWHYVPTGAVRQGGLTFANTLSPNTRYTLNWPDWGQTSFTFNIPSPPPPTDKTPPVIKNLPAPITADAQDWTGAVVTYAGPKATDNHDGSVPVSCDWPSGSKFPVGLTVVNCTASDQAGNRASAHFSVTVNPLASAPTPPGTPDTTTPSTPSTVTSPQFFAIAASQQQWGDLTPPQQNELLALFNYAGATTTFSSLLQNVRLSNFHTLNPCFSASGFGAAGCQQALRGFWFTAPDQTSRRSGQTTLAVGVGSAGVLSAAQLGGAGAARVRTLVGTTRVSTSRPDVLRLVIRPTRVGRKALAGHRRLKVRLRLTWAPNGGTPSSTVVRTTVLRRAG
jgi:hypothetical protein